MAFGVLLAVFWIAVGVFLLRAPDHLFRSPNPKLRLIGAGVAFLFAAIDVALLILA